MLRTTYQSGEITKMAKALYKEERRIKRLDGWFIAKEIEMQKDAEYASCTPEVKKAHLLCEVLRNIPISLSDNAIFVGTQRDAFAKSYALINPSFTVEGFSGYCDPMAIYNDIVPNEEFTSERIDRVRAFTAKTRMVEMLNATYKAAEQDTKEVVFFVEQVTGHVIPDFRAALRYGVDALIAEARAKSGDFYEAAAIALSGVKILAERDRREASTTALYGRMCEFCRMNASRALTVSEVAAHFHYNKDYVNRMFVKFSGTGLKAYIVACRIAYIRTLLLSDIPLKVVAQRSGFDDVRDFLKFFRYHESMTPTEFRNLYYHIHMNNH